MTGWGNVHTDICRDTAYLHPVVRERVLLLARYAKEAFATRQLPCELEVFETYRHPARQAYLLQQGVTKAAGWQSAHQFGLAADFVPRPHGRWTWDSAMAGECFDWLDANVRRVGLVRPIAWDRPHVEWPEFAVFRNGLDVAARLKPSGA